MSTLLAGDTAWWSDELVVSAFGKDEKVWVLGQAGRRGKGGVRVINAADENMVAKALDGGFDQVVFLSGELAFGGGGHAGELDQLSGLLNRLSRIEGVRALFVGTADVALERASARTVYQKALEALCVWYREQGLDLEILRVPHLSDPPCEQDYWRGACEALVERGSWSFDVAKDQPCDFVSMGDLARLVGTVFDEWGAASSMHLAPAGTATFDDAAHQFREALPTAGLSFAEAPVNPLREDALGPSASDLFGFACSVDVIGGLGSLYGQVSSGHASKKRRHRSLREAVRAGSPLVVVVELALGWLLVEWLNSVLGGNVQFRMVDLRLVYIMVFAATYGMRWGVVASVAMMVSLGAAYAQRGYTGTMLFYDFQNWLPFVFYLVVGSSLGYQRQRGDEDRSFGRGREHRMQEQLDFMSELYDDACAARNSYRHDLLESRDGFGRIFDVVRRLSLEEPSRIFSASIGVLEDVLDTKKAAIYVINDPQGDFARLVVSSRELDGRLAKSIRLDDYQGALEVVRRGEVWFNAGFEPGLPSYVSGIEAEGVLTVLIMVYDVPFEQASSYYMNLIRILSGLMENFLIRAWRDERARDEQRHVSGTSLLSRDAFVSEVSAQREMRQQHVGDYKLLEVDPEGRSITDLAEALGHQMRSTDCAGLGGDGRVYVLLRQVDDKTLPIVERRFERAGIKVRECTDEGAL